MMATMRFMEEACHRETGRILDKACPAVLKITQVSQCVRQISMYYCCFGEDKNGTTTLRRLRGSVGGR